MGDKRHLRGHLVAEAGPLGGIPAVLATVLGRQPAAASTGYSKAVEAEERPSVGGILAEQVGAGIRGFRLEQQPAARKMLELTVARRPCEEQLLLLHLQRHNCNWAAHLDQRHRHVQAGLHGRLLLAEDTAEP